MVEWKKIEEICIVLTGGDAPENCIKGQVNPSIENPYPIYSNGDDVYGYCSSYRVSKDAVTISSIGNVGSVNYRSANFTPIIRLKVVIPSSPSLKTKFLYYTLLGYKFVGTNSSLSSMKAADIKRLLIPIPSLSEQNRIVGILDTFTASIDNLKEQIAQRRKQYEYYRDQLLDLEGKEGAEMKTLETIAEIGTGSSNTQDELEIGKYPFFVRSQIVRYKDEYEFDETAIITSGDGVGVGKVLHYYEGKYALHQRAYRIHIFVDNFIPKFLFYFMQKDFYNYIMSNAFAASVTSVRKPMLQKYPIPVPSLSEQQRIVSILDTFEASIQNLEAQLEQRQKQYEYYRNKLLTFE